MSRIRLFYEIQADFEKIVHDAIEDLKYRKLYTQVEASLKKEEDIIINDYKKENASYLKYNELKIEVEQFDNRCIISSFDELHESENLLAEINKMTNETPELGINTQLLQTGIEYFTVSTAKLKWFLNLLDINQIAQTEQRRTLLFAYYGVNEQIILSEEWERISPVALSTEDIGPFCNYAFEYILRDPSFTDTVLEIMESIDDPVAEQTADRINVEQQKKIAEEQARKKEEKQNKKTVKQLAAKEDKTNQKEKDRETAASCLGCLGIIIFIAGFIFLINDGLIWGIILFVIGVFVIRGPFCYFASKSKKNNK